MSTNPTIYFLLYMMGCIKRRPSSHDIQKIQQKILNLSKGFLVAFWVLFAIDKVRSVFTGEVKLKIREIIVCIFYIVFVENLVLYKYCPCRLTHFLFEGQFWSLLIFVQIPTNMNHKHNTKSIFA